MAFVRMIWPSTRRLSAMPKRSATCFGVRVSLAVANETLSFGLI